MTAARPDALHRSAILCFPPGKSDLAVALHPYGDMRRLAMLSDIPRPLVTSCARNQPAKRTYPRGLFREPRRAASAPEVRDSLPPYTRLDPLIAALVATSLPDRGSRRAGSSPGSPGDRPAD